MLHWFRNEYHTTQQYSFIQKALNITPNMVSLIFPWTNSDRDSHTNHHLLMARSERIIVTGCKHETVGDIVVSLETPNALGWEQIEQSWSFDGGILMKIRFLDIAKGPTANFLGSWLVHFRLQEGKETLSHRPLELGTWTSTSTSGPGGIQPSQRQSWQASLQEEWTGEVQVIHVSNPQRIPGRQLKGLLVTTLPSKTIRFFR